MTVIIDGTAGITTPAQTTTGLTTATGGVVVGASAAPAFSAYRNSSQTISTNTWTKVAFDTKVYDTNTNFSTGAARFQPTVAGYYQLNGSTNLLGGGINGYVSIYKNGTLIFYGTSSPTGSGGSNLILTCSSIVYLNGTTDYVEIYAYSGGTQVYGDSTLTYFNGAMIRSA